MTLKPQQIEEALRELAGCHAEGRELSPLDAVRSAFTLGEDNGKAQVFEAAKSLMGGKSLDETKSAQRTTSGAAVALWLKQKAPGESMGRTMSGFNTAPSATRPRAGFCVVLWTYGPAAKDRPFEGADYDDAMAQAATWCAAELSAVTA